MINSGRRQAIPAFPAMKNTDFTLQTAEMRFFALLNTIGLILLGIFSDKTGMKLFSILKNVP